MASSDNASDKLPNEFHIKCLYLVCITESLVHCIINPIVRRVKRPEKNDCIVFGNAIFSVERSTELNAL